jgi:hypothetical protein
LRRNETDLTQAEKRGQDGRARVLGDPARKIVQIVQDPDERARVLAEAQYRKHALKCDDNVRVKIWRLGGFERLVIAEEGEHVGGKATEAEVEVARFACRILLRERIAEHVDLLCEREGVTWSRYRRS